MNRRANSRKWKLAVKIALACVLAAVAALVAVSWRMASEAPQAQAARVVQLTRTAKLLAADVQKGRVIQKQIPQIKSECDSFYQNNLMPSSSGYASVISDVAQMAKQAGVQTSGLSFHEKPVKDRSLKEVQISSAVEGHYQGLIRFMGELERSPHFYLLDELALTSEKSGMVALQFNLRTYFRS